MSIEIKNLDYVYSGGTFYEARALHNISLTISEGEFVGIVGKTGSGKSTLIQHLNGLEKATSGDVLYDGTSIYSEKYPLKKLRQKVGLVFQYPEYQLFEESVLKDVCFGPKNQGLNKAECELRAKEALTAMGVPEDLWDDSPFEISGGQKRRVAIAGILAMRPEVLVLDEPTAGLDPIGRNELLDKLKGFVRDDRMTVVIVSHSMDDMAEYVDRLLVLCDGELKYDGNPREVFSNGEAMAEMGLGVPEVNDIMHRLAKMGCPVDETIIRLDEAVDNIDTMLKAGLS